VAVAVVTGTAERVEAEDGPSTELLMRVAQSGVDDVRPDACGDVGVVVLQIERQRPLVDPVESARGWVRLHEDV
jgi:hypothetical protein